MKLNKKGFTIVELVIVIAVIAILAAVLIPTFSNVIKSANESAALQACTAAYTEVVADAYAKGNGKVEAKEYKDGNNKWGFTFTVESGAVKSATCTTDPYEEYKFTQEGTTWKVEAAK